MPASPATVLPAVRRHYPDAIPTQEATQRLLDLLEREYAMPGGRLLLADSVCADDVNSVEYPAAAAAMVGPFKLGGLNGFPHAGLTGMGAFASHVPDGGGIIIYHAPHIGVSESGDLGVIRRPGQSRATGCCGAARAAVAKLESGAISGGRPDDLDYQQGTVELVLLRQQDRILAAADRLKEATEVMYEAIAERIDLLVSRTSFPARYLVRFGGILINGDDGAGSFSSARRVLLTDLATGEERDLRPALEG
jgi:hypothetical protein